MLLCTINCSIGDKSKHFNADDICDLFLHIKEKNNLDIFEKYAIDIIQTEAMPQELEFFKNHYNIPQENIDYVLSIKPYAS